MARVQGKWALPELHVGEATTAGVDVCHCTTLIKILSRLGIGCNFVFIKLMRSRYMRSARVCRSVCVPIVEIRGFRDKMGGGNSMVIGNGALVGADGDGGGGGEKALVDGAVVGDDGMEPVWMNRDEVYRLDLAQVFGDFLRIRKRDDIDDGVGWEVKGWDGVVDDTDLGLGLDEDDMLFEIDFTGRRRFNGHHVDFRRELASGGEKEYRVVPIGNTNYSTKRILEQFFYEYTDGNARENVVPWFKRGWLKEADDFLRSEMKKARNPVLQIATQITSQSDVMVLRAPTKQYDVFLKALLNEDWQVNEIALVGDLINMFPNLIPKVIAIDRERRFLLTADFGKAVCVYQQNDKISPLYSHRGTWCNPSVSHRVVHALFEVQAKCSRQMERFDDLGIPRYEVRYFDRFIDELFNDPVLDRIIAPEEVLRLRTTVVENLKSTARTLDRCGIPPTLVHGDFGFHNIAIPEGVETLDDGVTQSRLLFFNWQESYISHPFFDMATIFDDIMPIEQETYFNFWKSYGSPEDIYAAFQCACALKYLVPAKKWLAMYKSPTLDFKDGINDGLRAMLRELGCCYYPKMFS